VKPLHGGLRSPYSKASAVCRTLECLAAPSATKTHAGAQPIFADTALRRRLHTSSPAAGGGPKRGTPHFARQAAAARARRCLLDHGSPFLEIGQLRHNVYGEDVPAAGMIAGIGRVEGRECMIVANDATVKGGTYYPLTVKKHLRAQEIALQNNCRASIWSIPAAPTCPARTRCFPTASISAASSSIRPTCRRPGIPQIAVVMGSCTAGGAYVPAMSDEAIMVRNQATIFLARPAAGESRDGRGSERRGARRRRCAHAGFPAWPTITPRRRTRARLCRRASPT
jgi:acetyl-CoA carboxylase carboxyltransferase component